MQPFIKLHYLSSVGPAKKGPEEGGARVNLKEKLDPRVPTNIIHSSTRDEVFLDVTTKFKVIFL